jgi:hypothetical protein
MSEALFAGFDSIEPPATEPQKWTERDMLDLLHERYSKNPGNGPRYVFAEHVRNQGGFGWDVPLRTADGLAIDLWPSGGHAIHGFEVKVSRADWLTELRDPEKAEAFKPYCDHWWLVVPDTGIVRDDLPEGWGLLAVARGGVLRVRKRAPKLDRQPMPTGMTAAWLRAVAKTACRNAPNESED